MSETEDKISQILNSPESLEKISEIAKSLKQSGFSGRAPDKKDEDAPPKKNEAAQDKEAKQDKKEESGAEAAETIGRSFEYPDFNKIVESLRISPAFLRTVGKAAQGFSDNERRVMLLNAIKPFARGKSSGTLERAIFALKLARAVRLLMEDNR